MRQCSREAAVCLPKFGSSSWKKQVDREARVCANGSIVAVVVRGPSGVLERYGGNGCFYRASVEGIPRSGRVAALGRRGDSAADIFCAGAFPYSALVATQSPPVDS